MPTQVSHGHQHLHLSPDVDPVSVTHGGSGRRTGIEHVAFARRDLGSQSMEKAEGGSISSLHFGGMPWPNAEDE